MHQEFVEELRVNFVMDLRVLAEEVFEAMPSGQYAAKIVRTSSNGHGEMSLAIRGQSEESTRDTIACIKQLDAQIAEERKIQRLLELCESEPDSSLMRIERGNAERDERIFYLSSKLDDLRADIERITDLLNALRVNPNAQVHKSPQSSSPKSSEEGGNTAC